MLEIAENLSSSTLACIYDSKFQTLTIPTQCCSAVMRLVSILFVARLFCLKRSSSHFVGVSGRLPPATQ